MLLFVPVHILLYTAASIKGLLQYFLEGLLTYISMLICQIYQSYIHPNIHSSDILAITDLKTIFLSQFVCIFLLHLHTKLHIPTNKQYKLNMTA
jgi:hypothetical protein